MSRVNPHFKVHTSIKNHRKMIEVYSDNDLLALWLRLGIESIERFAQRTDDSFLISDRELMLFTGKKQIRSSVKVLLKLTQSSPIIASKSGRHWIVSFPNLQRKQGFEQKNPPRTAASHSQSHSHKNKNSEDCAQAWIQAQEAAKGYGVKWGKITASRHRLVSARLAEHREVGVNVLAQAIHGYVTLRRSDDFDWKAYLTPTTILRPSKFPTYLDAYRQPQPEVKTTRPTADFASRFGKGRKT